MAINSVVPPSRRASTVQIGTQFSPSAGSTAGILPQKLALIGVGNSDAVYSTDPILATNSGVIANTYGYGSPLHLAALRIFPSSGEELLSGTELTVYPLAEEGAALPAQGAVEVLTTASGNGSFIVNVGGVDSNTIVVTADNTIDDIAASIADAITGVLAMPVTATALAANVAIESKFKGTSANELSVTVKDLSTTGVTFSITGMASGVLDPIIPSDLQFADRWETFAINTMASSNATALDALQSYGDARINPAIGKRFVAITGSSSNDFAALIATGDARANDQVNMLPVVENSVDYAGAIAADVAVSIASQANLDPSVAYLGRELQTTIGSASAQFSDTERDLLLKSGITYTYQESGVQKLGDCVTFYHPEGDANPAYQFVVRLTKLNQVVYRLNAEFNRHISEGGWLAASLISDTQTTTNANARKPSAFVSAAATIVNDLGLEAILNETEITIPLITAEIDGSNIDRVNLNVPVKIAGNVRIISVLVPFSFV